jgi:hypothetical protein
MAQGWNVFVTGSIEWETRNSVECAQFPLLVMETKLKNVKFIHGNLKL